jgi:hypothetical protein
MLRRIPKVLLLVTLLAAFAANIAPAFGRSRTCGCYILKGERIIRAPGGCHFDQSTLQCVSVSCKGGCF